MESKWVEKTLDEITEFIYDCPHSTPEWTDNGVVVLRNQNIRNGKLDLSVPSFTHEKGYEDRIKRAKPQEGDIVLTREAPMGEVCIIPKGLKCCLGQRVVLIRCNPKVCDSRFMLFSFQSEHVQHQIGWNEGTGTTVSNIRIPNIKSFKFKLPPLPIQKSIAHILGSLDDKIELNRRMNQTLEQMAQALFKSWFVDFDPVIDNALAAGNPIPDELQERAQARQALGNKRKPLPAHVQQLFPNEFEYSEVLEKWVPRGWRVGKISDVAANSKKTIQAKAIKSNTPYIGLQDMPQKSISLSEWGLSDNVASNKFCFEKGEFLFGKLRPYFHKVGIAPVSGVCSTDILVIYPKKSEWFSLVFGHLTSETLIDFVSNSSTGTRMPRTNWKDVSDYKISIPPINLADELSIRIKELTSVILKNNESNRILNELRNTLLPKLITGELNVERAALMIQ